ncbi:Rv3235 family protein [Frigoribacterium faeni]|uniref:3-hydroxyacyl-CoA dehydrogenase n=1 Tax=Frigoribacterium faeni TaxID=145483 RepID=A0A7W3JGC2_9MICO|nr:Rv3235 family protein [Frigoribacterium faeni]MBA8812331.1 hypothetical protein [Frigoribacterium faeni]BFF13388.1 hypothetical protein GCM10025699_46910 [Microbacterium flavescens]GEK83884.1 hypothetical protein FFA01_21930 [Frigoribacterium faeni]
MSRSSRAPSSPIPTSPDDGGGGPTTTESPESDRHLRAVPGCGVLSAASPDPFSGSTRPITAAEAVEALARSVLEVLAGARDLEQLSRWVTADVYALLQRRVRLSARARMAHGIRAYRPILRLGPVRVTEPSPGTVEAVVVVHGRGRSRAVAVRLETTRGRWRACALHVI